MERSSNSWKIADQNKDAPYRYYHTDEDAYQSFSLGGNTIQHIFENV